MVGLFERNLDKKRILIVCPYDRKTLHICEAIGKLSLELKTKNSKIEKQIVIVGKKDKITNNLRELNLDNRLEKHIEEKIIDKANDEDLVYYINQIMDEDTIIVIGEVNNYVRIKIGLDDEVYSHHVIDFPELRHFVFVSSSINGRYKAEEKKNQILSINRFMNSLGINKIRIAFIVDEVSKGDFLEINLMRMILKDALGKNVSLMNPCNLNKIFDDNYYDNIYDKKINLLVFKNNDITASFLDTLNIFSNSRICTVDICNNVKNRIFIDSRKQKDEQSIMFALLISKKINFMNAYRDTNQYIKNANNIVNVNNKLNKRYKKYVDTTLGV